MGPVLVTQGEQRDFRGGIAGDSQGKVGEVTVAGQLEQAGEPYVVSLPQVQGLAERRRGPRRTRCPR